MAAITFDRHSLIIDGQRTLIRCGAMHYFRLPHPNLWLDRLKKLKMSGYNAVDIYFNWDFHTKAPGQYDFTGVRDIKLLLDMIEDLGLYWIGRPGPYINAETTRGGLPGWLVAKPDVILRNRIEGEYQPSPAYMGYVEEWFDHILPFLKDRKNLLMVQVENEYSTLDMEPDYMSALIKSIKSHGIDVPTMHNDFYAAGLYADLVDIYAIDNYSVTAFDWNWRAFPDVFSIIDHLEEGIREEFCKDRPMMIAELQAGWFAGWKGTSYQKIKQALGRDHIAMVTRSFLGQGGTIFNHYKAVGGTNWDHLGATDAYTSYDFAAPISEEGLPNERLYEAKRINLLLSHFDLTQTERIAPRDIKLLPSKSLYSVRKDLTQPDAHWIFIRNLSPESISWELATDIWVETQPYHAAIIPHNVTLKNGWLLKAINVEPLIQTEKMLVLPGDCQTHFVIKTAKPIWFNAVSGIQIKELSDNHYDIKLKQSLAPDALTSIEMGGTRVFFLGSALIDRLWQVDPARYWIGPDMVISDTEAFVSHNQPCWALSKEGHLKPLKVPAPLMLQLPTLENWQWTSEPLPEEGFSPISADGAKMEANGLYNGAAWYRYEYEGLKQVLAIHAQHIWAVFLNGECLIADHTFHVHPDVTGPEDIVNIQLPQDKQYSDKPNTLTIFVESLGHHKGFHDDAKDPRGILSLLLDGKSISKQGGIQPVTFSANRPGVPSGIVKGHTEFTLAISPEINAPIGLRLEVPVERANIVLNGMLLGKYWQSCNNQTLFYLPEGVLNTNGNNQLTVTLMNFLPRLTVENPLDSEYAKIELEAFAVLTKLFV